MTTQFSIDLADLEEQIAQGSGYISLRVDVVGFWSNPITLYLKRDWMSSITEEPRDWVVEVTHSSGGYDGKNVPNLVAERNFADALLYTLGLAESLQARSAEFEAAFQARRQEIEAASERARAELQAKIDADPGFSAVDAKLILANMKAEALKTIYAGRRVKSFFRERGTDQQVLIFAQKTITHAVQFFDGSNTQVSAKELLARLQEDYSAAAGRSTEGNEG